MRTARSSQYRGSLSGVSLTETPLERDPSMEGTWPETPLERDPSMEGTWHQAARQEETSYRDPLWTDRHMYKHYLAPNFVCGR